MKIILLCTILFNVVKCQDSLYWFDMSTVIDKIPKIPKVLDKHFPSTGLDIVDSLRDFRNNTTDGFRLQIYESSSVDDVKIIRDNFRKVLSDSLYILFDAPLYRLHYGNYVTKNDAHIIKKAIQKKGYKNIWIVKSRINQNHLNNGKHE